MSRESETTHNVRHNGRDERGRFTTGNSGRPKGSRNKLTQAELDYIAAKESKLVEKLYELMECGNKTVEAKAVSTLLDFINNKDLNTMENDKPELNLDREALLIALGKELEK